MNNPRHNAFSFLGNLLSMLLGLAVFFAATEAVLWPARSLAQDPTPIKPAKPKPFGAGIDYGEAIPEELPEKEKGSIWPWVLAGGAALGALIMGYMAADSASSDTEESAAAAADSAEAAEDIQEDVAAGAAADATSETSKFTMKIIITGAFEAPAASTCDSTTNTIVPRLVFNPVEVGVLGAIPEHTITACDGNGTNSLVRGNYEQVSDDTIVIVTRDGYYNGAARVFADYVSIQGRPFVPVSGASIALVPVGGE